MKVQQYLRNVLNLTPQCVDGKKCTDRRYILMQVNHTWIQAHAGDHAGIEGRSHGNVDWNRSSICNFT